jgi:DNA-directed RNA polymerase alpha subunit
MSSIDKAYGMYIRHIYDEEKIGLLTQHKLKLAGSVPSVLWEAFGAVLTERSGSGLTGADLLGWEVKSAKMGGSFEYQYHLNTGATKLKEDCEVNHLFCTYSENYKDVSVRVMRGSDLAEKYFKSWEPDYLKNYDISAPNLQRRQRFRKNISFGYIETNGELVLRIEDSVITYRNDAAIPALNKAL